MSTCTSFREHAWSAEPSRQTVFAMRQGQNQSMGTTERMPAARRRPVVLRVVRRIQVDVVVQSRRLVQTYWSADLETSFK